MVNLQAVYLLSLNTKAGDEHKNENTHGLASKTFPLLKAKHNGAAWEQLHKNNTISIPH